ncbi:MAG: hypothetical protein M3Y34_04705 [Actinomycetota bacterium]|nr:hypothetical protein [Actinomycetota bacterium]
MTDRAGWALSALAAVALISFAGCGDSDDESGGEPEAEPVGQELGGSVAPLVSCFDWVDATEAERLATIEDVRSQVNLEGTGVDAPALSDAEAMEVFDNGCDRPEAAGFRLYLLYARAVSFKPLQDIAEGEVEAPSE